METNEEMTKETGGGKCCSSGSVGLKNLKTAIFVIVIIAACALAAHSVLSNETGSPCGGAAGLCPLNKSCGDRSICALKATENEDTRCIEKANTPPPCCPGIETPACCPNAGTPDCCCASIETTGCCPTTEVPSCCPSLKAE